MSTETAIEIDIVGERIKLRYNTLLVEREELLNKLENVQERLRYLDLERHLHYFDDVNDG